jgi:hypothetical protein
MRIVCSRDFKYARRYPYGTLRSDDARRAASSPRQHPRLPDPHLGPARYRAHRWSARSDSPRFIAGTEDLKPLRDWQGQPTWRTTTQLRVSCSCATTRRARSSEPQVGCCPGASKNRCGSATAGRGRRGWTDAAGCGPGGFLLADLTETPAMAYCERVFIMTSARTVAMCCCCCREARKGLRPADPRRHTSYIG